MFLRKNVTIHYVDSKGNRVTKNTPGARKRKVKGKKWVACYRDEYGRQHSETLYRDKAASQAELNRLLERMERRKAGIITPSMEHLKSDAEKVLEEFLSAHFKSDASKNPKYADETTRILRKMLIGCDVTKLGELNAAVVRKYLDTMSGAPNTKKKYHSAMSVFCEWLVERERIEHNFMVNVRIPRGDVQTSFRSLTVDEITKLLAAARERPLKEALTIRRGEKKGELLAKVTPGVRQQLEQEGWERSLLYKTAAMTGLRKEELARLKVASIDFEHKPYAVVELQAKDTKGKKQAKLWLVPELASELKGWILATGKQTKDYIFTVPEKLNRIFQRDLLAAGIESKDALGKVCKFRSLRVTGNVLLGRAGVPLKLRQLFMRHSDVRLTANQYDDTTLMDIQEIVPTIQSLNLPSISPA